MKNDLIQMIVRNYVKDLFESDVSFRKQVFDQVIEQNWEKIAQLQNTINTEISLPNGEKAEYDIEFVKNLF